MVMTAKAQKQNTEKESRLLDYLPSVFRDDKLMGQFLMIFDTILTPIENTVDNVPFYFDPRLTPEPLLAWLASWLDIALDSKWPLERRRELVSKAAELYRWRGTRRGLSEYLKIYTGTQPQIIEYIPGMILDVKTQLGVNTVLGSSGEGHHFTVILNLENVDNFDPQVIKQIIDSQKPAHTVYTLQINSTNH
jgi:phage tail-like protein